MSEMIKLKSADGFEFGALHADAQGRRKGGIIIIQEIFGIDEYIVADVARWASKGFEAIAPSLYDRIEPGFTAGHDEPGFAAGFACMGAAKLEDAMADIDACRAYLAPRGPVFIVGYCYGGLMTWQAAGRVDGLAAASSYYGGGVAQIASQTPMCPTICHFGRKDSYINADEAKAAIKAAQPQVEVYIYENSGHGFNNDGRPDSNLADAELSRKRTIALFEANGAA